MTLTFYNNTGDIRQLNKNLATISGCSNISAEITYEVSISEPSFVMNYVADLINANYVYVQEWARYYYITNKTMLDGNRIEITCHIDVLMSYKNEILNSDCIAERSASNVNAFIPDNLCGDEGTFNTVYRRASTTPFNSTGSYLLTVAGK